MPIEGVILEWDGCDPNIGDTLFYDVYFDDVNPPLTMCSSMQPYDWYELQFTLIEYKTYFWKVDTYDKMGEFAEGNVWSFSTGENHPPTAPIIKNEKVVMTPIQAPITWTHNFTFMSTDPEGHDVYYWIEWDDGSYEGWIGPYPSGEEITRNYTWWKKGTYAIRAKAKDIYDAESDWGQLLIPIERNKVFNISFLRFLKQFSNAFPVIR